MLTLTQLTQTIGDAGNTAAPFTQNTINKPLFAAIFAIGALIVTIAMITLSKIREKQTGFTYTKWEFIPAGMGVYVPAFWVLILVVNLKNFHPNIDTQPVREHLADYGISVEDETLHNAIRDSIFKASTIHVARGGGVEVLTLSSAKVENEDGSAGEYVVTWEVN